MSSPTTTFDFFPCLCIWSSGADLRRALAIVDSSLDRPSIGRAARRSYPFVQNMLLGPCAAEGAGRRVHERC